MATEDNMSEATSKATQDKNASANGATPAKETGTARKSNAVSIRLTPVDNSDRPVLANYSTINVSPGMAFIDFGFLEPGALSALPRIAKQGGKLPENLNGKLAVRVAMGYDAMANLHQQLGRMLAGLTAAADENKARREQK
jgi:hypothetical protein